MTNRWKDFRFGLLFVALLSAFLPALVVGRKPIRTIKVSFKGKIYSIHDVTTVSELQDQLQEASGVTNEALLGSSIMFRGKSLKATDILRRVGVKDGSKVVVTLPKTTGSTGSSRSKTTTTNSGEEGRRKNNSQDSKDNPTNNSNNNKFNGWGSIPSFTNHRFDSTSNNNSKNEGAPQSLFDWMNDENLDWNDVIEGLRNIEKDDVSTFIRQAFIRGYHQLRDWWNDPQIRNFYRNLSDPIQMETARQLVLNNPELKSSIERVPGGKQLLNDPSAWRSYFENLSDVAVTAGDVVLDGMLDVLVDVLQGEQPHGKPGGASGTTGGAGGGGGGGDGGRTDKRNTKNGSGGAEKNPSSSSGSNTIDPSVASNILFELSESELEDDDDDF